MEQQREQVAHTGGPLVFGYGAPYPDIRIRHRCRYHGQVLAVVSGFAGNAEAEANARLFAAAYTSYDKHCGPRAVECAEGDLLGELIEAATAVRDNNRKGMIGEQARNGWFALNAVLSKTLGKAG